MTVIRPEREGDHQAIREVVALAFGQEDEARLVEAVRRSSDFIPELSILAEEDGQIVGHILFSPITIETQHSPLPALALAPMAVRPEFQRRGIGSELVRRGLESCQRLDHRIIVMIGHADYYPRFGFSPARAKGLEAPFEVPDEAFMVLELAPGALDGVRGMMKYSSAFEGVG